MSKNHYPHDPKVFLFADDINKCYLEDGGNPKIDNLILKNLREFNAEQAGSYKSEPFTIYVKNDLQIVAGLTGTIIVEHHCLVDLMWVAKEQRRLGLGRKMFAELEKFARSKHCRIIQLDTTEFQAPGFYEKLGYTTIATLEQGFKNYTQYIMRKLL